MHSRRSTQSPKSVNYKSILAVNKNREIGLRIRDAIKPIEADGWRLARTKGSHRHFKHPFKTGLVTIAGRPGLDLHPKTLKSILKPGGHNGG